MRKTAKLLPILLIAIMLLSALSLIVAAEPVSSGEWRNDSDGKTRYYVNGEPVKGVCQIGDYYYTFSQEDGAFIGAYDGFRAVGTPDVPLTDEYRTALAALGSKVYGYYNFESAETLISLSDSLSKGVPVTLGNTGDQNTRKSVWFFTDSSIFDSTNKGRRMQFVQRLTSFAMVERGEGIAAKLVSPVGESDIHSYVSVYPNVPVGREVVIEAEFKLGETYSNGFSLQLIDRTNIDTQENQFLSVMHVNSEGGVYLNNASSHLLTVLTEYEYTRISLAIHPSSNTMDAYVNGVKVLSGVKFMATSSMQAKNFQIEEIRGPQFSAANNSVMFMDNIAVYTANKPVVTATPTPKNGPVLEGNALRYYEDNKIKLGAVRISGTFLGRTFNNEIIDMGTASGTGAYMLGSEMTVKIGENVYSQSIVGGNMFLAPDAVVADGGEFLCWKVTDGEKVSLLYPGNYYMMTGDSVCEAVLVSIETLDGASISTSGVPGEGTSLRFMGKVDRNIWEWLTESGIQIEAHMLIIPTEQLKRLHGYVSHEALLKAGVTEYTDLTVDSLYSSSESSNYFVGSSENIPTSDFTKKYSGIAYLKVTLTNGETMTLYSEYSENDNSRSVYDVAYGAYNDRITTAAQGEYSAEVQFGERATFSRYTDTRLSFISGVLDRVITLKSHEGKIVANGDFYTPPYEIDYSVNKDTKRTDIVIKDKKDWKLENVVGVYYDGMLLDASEYTLADKCKLSLDIGIQYTNDFAMESEKISNEHWEFFDVYYDSGLFPAVVDDPKYIHSSATDGVAVKWPYTASQIVLTPGKGSEKLEEFGTKDGNPAYQAYSEGGNWYYDLSDFKSLGLYCYCTKDSQTFMIIFASDNPATTDGEDYYSCKFNLSKGWNYLTVSKSGDFGESRSPLGWDKITQIRFVNSGWNQGNSMDTEVYFSDIIAYESGSDSGKFADARLSDAAVYAVGGYYSVANGKVYKNSLTDVNASVFEADGTYYMPITGLVNENGEDGEYYPEGGTLKFEYNGKSYIFNRDKTSYTVDGKRQNLRKAPKMKGDMLFFSMEDVMELFGFTQKYIDRMGLIVLSNESDIYDPDIDFDTIYSMIEVLIYVRPDGSTIISDLNSYSGAKHPYLLMNEDQFDDLRFYSQMDPTLKSYIASLEKKYGIGSAEFNDVTNVYQITDGRRLLSISRDVMNKTISWAVLAKVYEKSDPTLYEQYAERIWIELEAAANFHDGEYYSWHPDHFLDTGELAYPMAICYDWLYDYWVKTKSDIRTQYNDGVTTDGVDYNYNYDRITGLGLEVNRLTIMEEAMYWMALKVSNVLPADYSDAYIDYEYNIAGSTNNWNGVCNGGLMAAALALADVDRYEADIETYVSSAIFAIERGLWVYGPDGGYEEGPGYWSYGTTYTHVFMGCLNTSCGTTYGLYNAPGFAHSVYYTTYIGTKNRTWGFHDGGSGSADTNIAPWFAIMSEDAQVNAVRRQAIENGWKGVSMYDVLYFNPHLTTSIITLNLDAFYSLDSIQTFRSSWNPDNCIFAGLHGGNNSASHGDLDTGNFVINVNGIDMICDLGSDEYNMVGYFGQYRESYYRKRAEGHNTLVMIPTGESWAGSLGVPALAEGKEKENKEAGTNKPITDQRKISVSKTLRYESGTNSALAVVDMGVAYEEMNDGGIRGLFFTNNRSTVVIQDEATFTEAMDIWWFAHTEGEIEVAADGKSAIIARNGVYLYAEIVTKDSGVNATFTSMAADPLDSDYYDVVDANGNVIKDGTRFDGNEEHYTGTVEKSRSAYTKLCLTVENATSLNIAVAFTVIGGPGDAPERGTVYTWQDIADWKVD